MSYPSVSAERVVLPAVEGDLTVLSDRAPTSLLLRDGQVKVLDKENRIEHRYFVKGGIADIAQNVCNVSSEVIDEYNDMTIELAEQKRDAAEKQSEKDYYQMIVDEFRVFGKVK